MKTSENNQSVQGILEESTQVEIKDDFLCITSNKNIIRAVLPVLWKLGRPEVEPKVYMAVKEVAEFLDYLEEITK